MEEIAMQLQQQQHQQQQLSSDDAKVLASFRSAFDDIYDDARVHNKAADAVAAATTAAMLATTTANFWGTDDQRPSLQLRGEEHGGSSSENENDDPSAEVVATVSTVLGPLPVYDFVQWTSSFTMSQIPTDAMLTWVRCSVDRFVANTASQWCAACRCWRRGGNGHADDDDGTPAVVDQEALQRPRICCCPFRRRHRVLDIGCGTGLVLMDWLVRLAEAADANARRRQHVAGATNNDPCTASQLDFADMFWYTGVELSSNCVHTLRTRLRRYVPQVEGSVHVFCAAAHEVAFNDASWWAPPPPEQPTQLEQPTTSREDLFDSAIVNSVTMYLPSMEYLERLLVTTAAHLARGGCIFVGDNRDSRLLRLFYLSIALHRNGLDFQLEGPAEVLATFDNGVANDPHLLVSPMDFIRIGARLGATSVLLQPKLSTHSYAKAFCGGLMDEGCAGSCGSTKETDLWGPGGSVWASLLDNEMTRFRFDVSMYTGGGQTDESTEVQEGASSSPAGSTASTYAPGVCAVSIPVDDQSGDVLSSPTLPAYQWRREMMTTTQGDTKVNETMSSSEPLQVRHRRRLRAFVARGVASLSVQEDAAVGHLSDNAATPSYWLFAYPHVPVLFDALIGESRVDRGGGAQTPSSPCTDRRVRLAIRAAQSLLTPRELLDWFALLQRDDDDNGATERGDIATEDGWGTPQWRRWRLEPTVHPSDPTMLVCIVYPAGCVLRVAYPLVSVASRNESDSGGGDAVATDTAGCGVVATERESKSHNSALQQLSNRRHCVRSGNRRDGCLHLRSSQPKTNPRQAHFFDRLDMLDRWLAVAVGQFNDTQVVYPVPLLPVGAMLWESITTMLTASQTTTTATASHSKPSPPCVRQRLTEPLGGKGEASCGDHVTGADGNVSLTWLELAERVHALAEAMTTVYRVAPGDFVVQFVDRSLDQIVGMLAIFTVGAVFVPLAASPNPDPPARIAKVIVDCAPTLMLTQPHLMGHLEEALSIAIGNSNEGNSAYGSDNAGSLQQGAVLGSIPIACAAWHLPTPTCFVGATNADVTHEATTAPETAWCLRRASLCKSFPVDGAAYCIYTSGSTSLPKAVVISHRNFHNLLCAFHFGNEKKNVGPSNEEDGGGNNSGAGGHPTITATATTTTAWQGGKAMHTLQTTATSFDLHVYECLSPLLAPFLLQGTVGGAGTASESAAASPASPSLPDLQLILLPPGAIDLQAYVETMEAFAVTHVVCTPTLLSAIAEHCALHDSWASLRHVRLWRTGGEALKQKLVDAVLPVLRRHNANAAMWCSYGPAECTDTATMSECVVSSQSPMAASSALVSLGRPLANYGAYVMVEPHDDDLGEGRDNRPLVQDDAAPARSDCKLRLARVGEVGMIYLSGPSVFNGYLKRPDITASVLVQLEDGTTLYRTGDLGRMAAHATTVDPRATLQYNLFYVGRVDFAQVKLRGQRIETTEIEGVLMTHPRVRHVIVVKHTPPPQETEEEGGATARGDDDLLVAYFALDHPVRSAPSGDNGQTSGDGGTSTDMETEATAADDVSDALRALAMRSFPSFMVPSVFQHVDAFKTNRNGKVDRKLLPPPSTAATRQPHPLTTSPPAALPFAGRRSGEGNQEEEHYPTQLCWLRQQLLHYWLELNPSVKSSDPALLTTTTPAMFAEEPVFCSGWMEMGASSLVLMRYISKLKHFMGQWYRTHGSNDWAQLPQANGGHGGSGGATASVHRTRGGGGSGGGDGLAVVGFPAPDSPPLTAATRKALQHVLTFPQMYQHRSINGVSLALFRVLYPSGGRRADVVQSADGGALTAAATSSGTSMRQGAGQSAMVEEGTPSASNAPPWGYRLRWGTLLRLVFFKNRTIGLWTSLRQKLRWLRGVAPPPMEAALAGTTKHPCCTQQSIMVIDELHRLGDAPDRDGIKNFYNCPYTFRVRPHYYDEEDGSMNKVVGSGGRRGGGWTLLGDGQAVAARLEAILTDIVRRHPSLRMILTWEGDRAAQHEYQLEGCHADACKLMQHVVYNTDGDDARTSEAPSDNNSGQRRRPLHWDREDFFAFSGVAATSGLARAIDAAANERLTVACNQRRFHFHVFYELQGTTCSNPAADGTTAVQGPPRPDTPLVSMHVMLNFHHATFDGESIHQLLRQVEALARTPLQPQAPPPPPPQQAYLAYCKWVDDGKPWTEQFSCVQYWLRHMEGWQTAVAITKTMPRTRTAVDGVWHDDSSSGRGSTHRPFTGASAKIRRFVPKRTAARLMQFCAAHDITPYCFFMTCYYMTLSEYQRTKPSGGCSGCLSISSSGRDDDNNRIKGNGGKEKSDDASEVVDICIGSAMSNRGGHVSDTDDALASSLCLLADTYPFRLRFQPNVDTVGALLVRVQHTVAAHMMHSATALGVIFVALMIEQPSVSVVPPRSPIKNPFFGAVLLYEDRQYCQTVRDVPVAPLGPASKGHAATALRAFDLEMLDLPDFGAIFEIQLKVSELEPESTLDGSPLALTWEYATELYSAATMEALSSRYWSVVHAMLFAHCSSEDDGDGGDADVRRCDHLPVADILDVAATMRPSLSP